MWMRGVDSSRIAKLLLILLLLTLTTSLTPVLPQERKEVAKPESEWSWRSVIYNINGTYVEISLKLPYYLHYGCTYKVPVRLRILKIPKHVAEVKILGIVLWISELRIEYPLKEPITASEAGSEYEFTIDLPIMYLVLSYPPGTVVFEKLYVVPLFELKLEEGTEVTEQEISVEPKYINIAIATLPANLVVNASTKFIYLSEERKYYCYVTLNISNVNARERFDNVRVVVNEKEGKYKLDIAARELVLGSLDVNESKSIAFLINLTLVPSDYLGKEIYITIDVQARHMSGYVMHYYFDLPIKIKKRREVSVALPATNLVLGMPYSVTISTTPLEKGERVQLQIRENGKVVASYTITSTTQAITYIPRTTGEVRLDFVLSETPEYASALWTTKIYVAEIPPKVTTYVAVSDNTVTVHGSATPYYGGGFSVKVVDSRTGTVVYSKFIPDTEVRKVTKTIEFAEKKFLCTSGSFTHTFTLNRGTYILEVTHRGVTARYTFTVVKARGLLPFKIPIISELGPEYELLFLLVIAITVILLIYVLVVLRAKKRGRPGTEAGYGVATL